MASNPKTSRSAKSKNTTPATPTPVVASYSDGAVVGHDAIRNYFHEAFTSHKLHHAHIFLGPSQIGKETVAWSIIQKILSMPSRVAAARHTDLYHLDQSPELQNGTAIGIDEVRQMQQWLSRSSFHGGWKVALISSAERLSLEAQNALLKTLEEPQPRTVIFLLTTTLANLLPTIRSRCFVMQFYPVPTATICTALTRSGYDQTTAEHAATHSNGRPGRAITIAATATSGPLPLTNPTITERLSRANTITNHEGFQPNRRAWDEYLHQCEAIVHERLRHGHMSDRQYRQRTLALGDLIAQSLHDNHRGYMNPKFLNEYFHIFASV